jgi:hypothetical protein
MKPCGLLLVGPKTFVNFPSCLVILTHSRISQYFSQKLIAKGKAEAEYLVCFPNFMCKVSYQFFDTVDVDRSRVLILTIWFFSSNISGYMNRRNTELLTFSAGLGRNTAGPVGSRLQKLSKLTSD